MCQLCLTADVDRAMMTTTWQTRARSLYPAMADRWQMAGWDWLGCGARAKERLVQVWVAFGCWGVAQINGGLGGCARRVDRLQTVPDN